MHTYKLDVKETLDQLDKINSIRKPVTIDPTFVPHVKAFLTQSTGISSANAIARLINGSLYDKALIPDDTFVHPNFTVDAPDLQSAMDVLEMLVETGSYYNAVHDLSAEQVYGMSKSDVLKRIGWIVYSTIAVIDLDQDSVF